MGSTPGAVFMTDAVKSIATNALLKPFIGARVDCSSEGQLAVKRCIEYDYLRHRWQHLLNGLDAFQIGRVMGRSKNGKTLDRCFYLGRDEGAFSILLASVDNAVTDDINLRRLLDHPG